MNLATGGQYCKHMSDSHAVIKIREGLVYGSKVKSIPTATPYHDVGIIGFRVLSSSNVSQYRGEFPALPRHGTAFLGRLRPLLAPRQKLNHFAKTGRDT